MDCSIKSRRSRHRRQHFELIDDALLREQPNNAMIKSMGGWSVILDGRRLSEAEFFGGALIVAVLHHQHSPISLLESRVQCVSRETIAQYLYNLKFLPYLTDPRWKLACYFVLLHRTTRSSFFFWHREPPQTVIIAIRPKRPGHYPNW